MNILDFLFPPTCLGCRRLGAYLCADCVNQIQPLRLTICPQCAKPSPYGLTHARCQSPSNLNGLTCLFPYQGILRTAITKHKFKFVKQLTQTLIDLSISLCDLSQLSNKEWLVCPIPLHPKRFRSRGFNQSAELAKPLADYLQKTCAPDLLLRTRHTKPQSTLSGDARRQNLKGAFVLNPHSQIISSNSYAASNLAPSINSASKPPILLVDDVYTTGSTLKEAAKTLKKNGYSYVWGLTLARKL